MSAAPLDRRIAAVLEHFNLSPLEVCAVSGGFSEARVWRVKTTAEQLVALRWSAATDSTERERRESICRWMQFARCEGCHWAPQPFKPHDSRPTGSAAHFLLSQPDGWWQAETWMPGCPLDTVPSPAQLQQTLAVLAHLHHTGRCWALQESPVSRGPAASSLRLATAVSPGLLRRLQLVRELQSGALTRLLAAAAQDPDDEFRQLSQRLECELRLRLPPLHQQLEELAPQTFTLQPVLRDLWQPHVLFSGDHVTGVIDWNAAATDHPAFDYSRLLASWYGQLAVNLLPLSPVPGNSLADTVVCHQRFHSAHWTATEQQLLRVCLEASLLLSPVTWLHRRCAKGPATLAIAPNVLERFCRLVSLACGPNESQKTSHGERSMSIGR